MTDAAPVVSRPLAASVAVSICMALAFLIVYFIAVFVCPIMVRYYSNVGLQESVRFRNAHFVSDFLAAYTPFVVITVGVYVIILQQFVYRTVRCMYAVSHVTLLAVLFFVMVYTTWMIDPILSTF